MATVYAWNKKDFLEKIKDVGLPFTFIYTTTSNWSPRFGIGVGTGRGRPNNINVSNYFHEVAHVLHLVHQKREANLKYYDYRLYPVDKPSLKQAMKVFDTECWVVAAQIHLLHHYGFTVNKERVIDRESHALMSLAAYMRPCTDSAYDDRENLLCDLLPVTVSMPKELTDKTDDQIIKDPLLLKMLDRWKARNYKVQRTFIKRWIRDHYNYIAGDVSQLQTLLSSARNYMQHNMEFSDEVLGLNYTIGK